MLTYASICSVFHHKKGNKSEISLEKRCKMADWIIGSLLFAWFLSWFGFDGLFVKAINELFNLNISYAVYYFVFFIAAVIFGTIDLIKNKKC
jgi:uncharacterized membrane protein